MDCPSSTKQESSLILAIACLYFKRRHDERGSHRHFNAHQLFGEAASRKMKGLIFTYALAYGGAATSLFRPLIGLYIYVLFAIIKPESLWPWSVPQGGQFSRIIAIALLLGWVISGCGDWRLGSARPIVFAFVGFWCWAIVCALFAPDWDRSWYFIESIAKILIPFCVGVTLLKTIDDIRL